MYLCITEILCRAYFCQCGKGWSLTQEKKIFAKESGLGNQQKFSPGEIFGPLVHVQCTVYFPLNVLLQTWLHTSCRLISSLLYFSREASPANSTQFWGSCGLTILDLELLLSAWGCFGVEGIRYLDATELEPGTSREKLRERCTEIQYLITMSGLIDRVWISTPSML